MWLATVGAEQRFRPQQHIGNPTPLLFIGQKRHSAPTVDIVDAMLMRAETLFRPYNNPVEAFISRSKFVFASDTVCICRVYSLYLPRIQSVFAANTKFISLYRDA